MSGVAQPTAPSLLVSMTVMPNVVGMSCDVRHQDGADEDKTARQADSKHGMRQSSYHRDV